MGKKPKGKKKSSGKIWILPVALAVAFCAWVYWGNIPDHPRPVPVKVRQPATPSGGRSQQASGPAEEKKAAPAAEPVQAVTAIPAGEEERAIWEKIRRSEAAGKKEEAARARFELSDWYLQKALWEWTEFKRNGSDLELTRKALAVLDEVIRSRPGTEEAAEAQLRRAKVYRNGLSGLWDQGHRREAREELHKVLESYPRSAAAREAREMLGQIGK